MSDSREHPERDARPDASDSPAGARRVGGVEDTPVRNPLTVEARRRVAQWLEEGAGFLAEQAAGGPAPGELAEMQVDRDEWARRMEEVLADVRFAAEQVHADPVPFSAAAQARNLLMHADEHDLIAAGAALDAVLAAAMPERMEAYDRELARRLEEHGFCVQVVGGRGEPLPLPGFAYTLGLGARASHPELVIVGMPAEVAYALLADLSKQILAGERSLQAGDDLDGLLTGGYKLRVIECPPHLVAQTRQDPANPAGALQLLIPDKAGRFLGDPDVDPEFALRQRYPDRPA